MRDIGFKVRNGIRRADNCGAAVGLQCGQRRTNVAHEHRSRIRYLAAK